MAYPIFPLPTGAAAEGRASINPATTETRIARDISVPSDPLAVPGDLVLPVCEHAIAPGSARDDVAVPVPGVDHVRTGACVHIVLPAQRIDLVRSAAPTDPIGVAGAFDVAAPPVVVTQRPGVKNT